MIAHDKLQRVALLGVGPVTVQSLWFGSKYHQMRRALFEMRHVTNAFICKGENDTGEPIASIISGV